MIFQVGNRDIVFQESVATALNRRFNFLFLLYFIFSAWDSARCG